MSDALSPDRPPNPGSGDGESVEPRIGDRDRDQAVSFLQEHHAQGRLDQAEFEERMERALRARYASDLDGLFTDLPQPRPGDSPTFVPPPWQAAASPTPPATVAPRPAAPPPVPFSDSRALAVATAVAWPLTLLAIFWLGWPGYWWLVFIPIAISSIAGKNRHDRGHR